MTIVTHSIGTGGGYDYTTLQAWEDAAPSDLVSATTIWKGEVYKAGSGTNGEFTSSRLGVAGSTTNSSYYKWLTAAAGHSFADNANKDTTNRLAYDTANGAAFTTSGGYDTAVLIIQENYFRCDRLQIRLGSSHSSDCTIIGNGLNAKVFGCIIQADSGECWRYYAGSGDSAIAINCAMSNKGGTNRPNGYFLNCTFGGDCVSAYNNHYAINCFAMGTWSSSWAGGDYNASVTGSTPPGAHSVTGLTATNEVVATGGSYDFKLKAGNHLDGAGTVDSRTEGVDIFGHTRSLTTPSIGCYETPASPAATFIPKKFDSSTLFAM